MSKLHEWSLWFGVICAKRVKQRLILYHGAIPIYMEFSDDAEETFSRALNISGKSFLGCLYFKLLIQYLILLTTELFSFINP
uniref:Uncharacterized protein n=1 Tax=Lactuca sativa TaxID=4236 RepID=A0A9R1V587_LACSA|nr:hypothetical protein LSAT_V11C600311330 [Lactuca sativa]